MKSRPHIVVNVAMTADGKIDSAARKGATISSAADKARVDGLRASVDAVLVGGRTLLNEDPKLTVKSAKLRAERLRKGWSENPAKVGVISKIPFAGAGLAPVQEGRSDYSRRGQDLPLRHFLTSGPAQVFLFTTQSTEPEVLAAFESAGVKILVMGSERVDLVAVFQSLFEAGIRSVLVEGGGTLIAELFHLDLVDELTVYIAPKIFGGSSAPTLADGPGFLHEQAPGLILKSVGKYDGVDGILVHYTIEHKE